MIGLSHSRDFAHLANADDVADVQAARNQSR
jgi:hypothetical protein